MSLLNKLFVVLLILLACGILAYAYLDQRGLSLRFSEAELEQRLSEHLPYKKKALAILEFEFDQPEVELNSSSERISVSMHITLEIAGRTRRDGAIKVSGSPSYRASEGAFYLSNPRIDEFDLEGLSSKYSGMASSAITGIVRTLYADKPLYELDTSYSKQRITKLVLREISVTDTHMIAVLGPAIK